jgi:predicted O-methyltransferase YrrM
MENPMAVLEKVRGFMQSRIILTGAELDLFTQINRGVNSVSVIAKNNQLDFRAVIRLLDALVVYGLLVKDEDVYRLTAEGLLLSSDHPESALPMVLHMNDLWNDWSHLTDTVIQGKNPALTAMSEDSEESTKAFIGAMHVVGQRLSQIIAESIDLSPYHKLLDIGGASGTYTIAFLKQNTAMNAVIFDLKTVLPMAEERIRESGLQDRVELVGGDFYIDELPAGCDLALLSAIIHQNSPEQNLELYKKIYRALVPGGTLMIRDHIMEDNRIQPPAGAVFAINMLVATDGGDTFTFHEIKTALETVGFIDIRQIRQEEHMDGIVTAKKPSNDR